MKIAILIIAAGTSRRLGQPKQLLPFRGRCLLDFIIRQCTTSEVGDVFLVLGAYKEQIETHIDHHSIHSIFYNKNWQNGMGSSIACGVSGIQDLGYDGVIITLADQPFFHPSLLQNLVKKHQETEAPIVISKYEQGQGPPTFFKKSLFPELVVLANDTGAKPIVKKYRNSITSILFKNGHLDIDKPEDLDLLYS